MAYYKTYMPDETGALQRVVINAGIGFCLPFYGETAPPGTLACDGSEISREAYSELFEVLGTKAGAGDGSTTFNLPDFRGCFIRGTGGNAAALGTEQGDAIRDIKGRLDFRRGDNQDTNVVFGKGHAFGDTDATTVGTSISINTGILETCQGIEFLASRVVPTADENRPVNVALLWCIIYE